MAPRNAGFEKKLSQVVVSAVGIDIRNVLGFLASRVNWDKSSKSSPEWQRFKRQFKGGARERDPKVF